jgi:hypothetical protein
MPADRDVYDRKSPDRHEDGKRRRQIPGRSTEQAPDASGPGDAAGEVAGRPELRIAVDKRGLAPSPREMSGDHGLDLVSRSAKLQPVGQNGAEDRPTNPRFIPPLQLRLDRFYGDHTEAQPAYRFSTKAPLLTFKVTTSPGRDN